MGRVGKKTYSDQKVSIQYPEDQKKRPLQNWQQHSFECVQSERMEQHKVHSDESQTENFGEQKCWI